MRRQPQSLQREVFLHASLLSALFSVLAGLAIARVYADASQIRSSGNEVFVALLGVSLLVHAVNFYHGATSVLYDDRYLLAAEGYPLLRLTRLGRNVGNFVCLAIVAGGITNYVAVAAGECLLRLFDSIGLGIEVASERSKSLGSTRADVEDPAYISQRRYWIFIDLACLAILGPFLLIQVFPAAYGALGVPLSPFRMLAVLFSALMFVDVGLDYAVYGRRYLSSTSTWEEMAERWDRLQGEHGDIYRRQVLHPFIVARLHAHRQLKVVVDAGCGNGCTARFLAGRGYTALGFDVVERSIDIAKLYAARDSRRTAFFVGDLSQPKKTADRVREVSGAAVDAVIALFSLQDCPDVLTGMATCAELLRPGGIAIVVFESPEGIADVSPHRTTSRRFIESGRRQVITWLPVEDAEGSSVSGPDEDRLVITVTNVRLQADYSEAAVAAGLTVAGAGLVPLSTPPDSLLELDYSRHPKFAYVELVKP